MRTAGVSHDDLWGRGGGLFIPRVVLTPGGLPENGFRHLFLPPREFLGGFGQVVPGTRGNDFIPPWSPPRSPPGPRSSRRPPTRPGRSAPASGPVAMPCSHPPR